MTTDPQTRPPDPPPSSGVLRFALTAGAWFIGLFGLMRLGWVERQLLLPFAQLQERVADQLTGVQTDAVYVDASCSGGDAMALCLGAVLAFPATWSARLRGAGIGLLVIAAFNIVRIGNLSLVAAYPIAPRPPPYLHLASHPHPGGGRLCVRLDASADGTCRPRRRLGSRRRLARPCPAVSAAHRRGDRRLLRGGWVGVRERPTAHPGRLGGHDQRRHPGGPWGVSHGLREHRHDDARGVHCDPGVYCHPPDSGLRGRCPGGAPRAVAARGGPGRGTGDLLPLGRARLLVLALPTTLVASHTVAIHAFSQVLVAGLLVAGLAVLSARSVGRQHPARRAVGAIGVGIVAALAVGPLWSNLLYWAVDGGQLLVQHGGHRSVDDPQGALAILPALQLGLCAAFWAAVGARGSWRRLVLGVVGLAGLQLTVLLGLGELSHHLGFAPHVSLIRAWGVVAPLAVVWVLRRPRLTVSPPAPVPVHPLPQPG